MTITAAEREKARQVADRGATLLDERRPGWWKLVELPQLMMSSSFQCVLGHVFYEEWATSKEAGLTEEDFPYNYGRHTLHPDDIDRDLSWVIAHGFESGFFEALKDEDSVDVGYSALEDAWTEIIRGHQQRSGIG